jgi:transcriptional regulator with XRE-family HTH domain
MRLHEKISFIRNLKGLKQDEMAQKLNMSESGYAKIERGETKLQNPRIEKIAEALEIETEDLMSFNERSICITSFHDHSLQIVQNNYANLTIELNNELEKFKFMVEQKDKEIAYLKEIIELMKKNS